MIKVKIFFFEELMLNDKDLSTMYIAQKDSINDKLAYNLFDFPCVPMIGMGVNLESFDTCFDEKELDCLNLFGPFEIFDVIIHSKFIVIALIPNDRLNT